MKEVMILLSGCMEAVKIYLLMHFMSGCKEVNDKKKYMISLFWVIAIGIIDICFIKNIITYFLFTIGIICVFFDNKLYKNIIWSIWAAPVVSLFDYFWVVILQFLLKIVRNKSNAEMFDIAASICTIMTITFIGNIYKKINREGYRMG